MVETAVPAPPTFRNVRMTLRGLNGQGHEIEVMGETTANEHLIVTPDVRDGFTGCFSLFHIPTGRTLHTADPEVLRDIANRIAHFDWSFVDREAFQGTPVYVATVKAIRAAQFIDEAGGEPLAAYDAWGPAATGNGLKRQALPMIQDFLADWQRSDARTGGANKAVPMSVPDANGGMKANPEWTYEILRQVHNYGLAYLLGALHRVDSEVADSAAAALADAWESGDSIGEWIWQWGQELAGGKPLTLPGVPGLVGDLFGEPPELLEGAMYAAKTGAAGHWPTVAGILRDEVQRLRSVHHMVGGRSG